MNKTNIEYLSHSWNPLAMKCTPISEGCKNCWHLALANRLAKNPMIPENRQNAYAGEEPVLIEKGLHILGLRQKKPAIIGVQFMGDLFHKTVPFDWIATIFGIMLHSYAKFLILTKRPQRMLDFFKWLNSKASARRQEWIDVVAEAEKSCGEKIGNRGAAKAHGAEFIVSDYADKYIRSCGIKIGWPLENVYLGVTCENQQAADERIPIFLQIPAAVSFVSLEPLLGDINLKLHDYSKSGCSHSVRRVFLNWVIVGGESGPGARPMHPDWARSIRDQCQAASVPFFFKQWGEWIPIDQHESFNDKDPGALYFKGSGRYYKVGKKKAGRILDGRVWDEMPAPQRD